MSLFDIELLNHIFYRSEYILKYIERRKEKLSLLDIEGLANTIINELVINNIMDPNTQSLDIIHMEIVDNLSHICYEKHPFIVGIPSTIKEHARNKILNITAGYPVSVYMSKPAGRIRYCIYDMNTALSSIFDEFSLVEAEYDSPTRIGERTESRPFLIINYNNYDYYVDLLTQRMFRKDLFDSTYNVKLSHVLNSKEFSDKQREIYEEQVRESGPTNHSSLITMTGGFEYIRDIPKMEEFNYEYELAKERYPEAFKEAEEMKKEIKRLPYK